jgi:hypothetical protein
MKVLPPSSRYNLFYTEEEGSSFLRNSEIDLLRGPS